MPQSEPASLKQRILRAGAWTFVGFGLSQAIRLGGNLVMTRLLVPEMFGVMAIASIVLAMLGGMSDLGLHHNIVQSPRGKDPSFLDTAWALQALRGGLMWSVALLFSGALYAGNQAGWFPSDSVYASPELPLVIAVGTFSAVISGFQSTGVALAQRDLDQKRLVQMELMAQLAALIFMVGVGVATRSIWALVAGGLVGSAVSFVLSHVWLRRHRDRLKWDKSALHELITFGKWTFVSSIFTVLSLNGDKLLLGGYLSADMLGLFAIAAMILATVEGVLGKFFSAVSLPALSEIARNAPARLRTVYYKLRVPGDTILLFSGGALFAAGQSVIDLLYDSRYTDAGSMLQVLALSLVAARYNVTYHIYLAIGKPRYLAIISLVRCAALFVIVPFAYAIGGAQAAIWGIALHGLPMIPVVLGFNAHLGLFDARRELLVLFSLPVGFGCGHLVTLLIERF